MTVDEYASFQRANGLKLTRIDDIWWGEVRPFFFRPLLPYTEIIPNSKQYPFKSLIGGVKHVVPSGEKNNSNMNYFVFDDLQRYSLKRVKDKRRNEIRKGLTNFSAKRIENVKEFIDEAYDVYISFYRRTQYNYLKERVNNKYFAAWATNIFKYPQMVIIGAYHHNKLSAVSISYLIEGVIFYATFFSDAESYKLQVGDFMIHIVREAASLTDAKCIFMGMVTGQKSLDNSKIMRGCKLVKMPAYYRLNPIALYFAKALMKHSYKKLIGLT